MCIRDRLHSIHHDDTDSSASILSALRPNHAITNSQFVPLFDRSCIPERLYGKRVVVLKIDVEGAELEVMNGLKSLIAEHKPAILLEILPVYHAKNGYRIERQKKLLSLIQDLDYSILRILKHNGEFISLKKIETIEVHSDLNKCDYLLIQEEQNSTILESLKMRIK